MSRTSGIVASTLALLLGGCSGIETALPPIIGPKGDAIAAEFAILELGFSADSRFLGHQCQDGSVRLWDVLRNQETSISRLQGQLGQGFAVASRRLFAGVVDDEIQIWHLDSGIRARIARPAAGVAFLLLDSRSKYVAIAGKDGVVDVWDTMGERRVRRLTAPISGDEWRVRRGAGFSIAHVSPLGVRITNLDKSGPGLSLSFRIDTTGGFAMARDAGVIASTDATGRIIVRETPSGRVRSTMEGFGRPPSAIALSPDGTVLAVAKSASVELWDCHTGERVDSFESAAWTNGGIKFSPDGLFLAWVEKGQRTVRFWSPVREVMRWTESDAHLITKAESVCKDLISMIRYRVASAPYDNGMQQLSEKEFKSAVALFDQALRVFAIYPGLAAARAEADERFRAEELTTAVAQLEARGAYSSGLKQIDAFLATNPRFDNYGFAEHATRVRTVLGLFHAAEEHLLTGRSLQAILVFEQAIAIIPEFANSHPEYSELRKSSTARLIRDADAAERESEFELQLSAYADLERLMALDPPMLLRRARAHEQLGSLEDAETAYAKVTGQGPEFVAARRSLAQLARADERYAFARQQLELARALDQTSPELESEYAEICELLEDLDASIAAWKEVAEMRDEDPIPYETIARIEAKRKQFVPAAKACRAAIKRSKDPRPKLLLEIARLYMAAGNRGETLFAYQELQVLARENPALVETLAENPARWLDNRIRQLDYVRHRGEWVPRETLLAEQGWVLYGTQWIRPAEKQLREVANNHRADTSDPLRVHSDQRYAEHVREKQMAKGMNRREVIEAWGFFSDQNVFVAQDGTRFDQFQFADSRLVYLRNGWVCFWSE